MAPLLAAPAMSASVSDSLATSEAPTAFPRDLGRTDRAGREVRKEQRIVDYLAAAMEPSAISAEPTESVARSDEVSDSSSTLLLSIAPMATSSEPIVLAA